MKNKRIVSLLLAAAISASFIGCSKKNDTSKTNGANNVTASDKGNESSEDQKEEQAPQLITLNTKDEALAFSKEAITKVEAIFKKNNLEYSLTSDYRYIAYDGAYEKLGQGYDVDIYAYFFPYYEQDTETSVTFAYRIPLSQNTDVTKLNVPQLNVIMDAMLEFDDTIKNKFNSREELIKQLNDELHGENTGESVFDLSTSNIKSESECRILSGGIDIAKAMVKSDIRKAAEYTFDKYDDYVGITEKANNEIISTMKNAGLNDVNVHYSLKVPCGQTSFEANYYKESYYCGMKSNEDKDYFNITYILNADCIPFDVENNKIKDTKYIKALVDTLNSSEYFKNKFTYEEFMNEIYNKTKFGMNNIDTVRPSENIDGLDKLDVYVDKNENILKIRAEFINPAVVEGQSAR